MLPSGRLSILIVTVFNFYADCLFSSHLLEHVSALFNT